MRFRVISVNQADPDAQAVSFARSSSASRSVSLQLLARPRLAAGLEQPQLDGGAAAGHIRRYTVGPSQWSPLADLDVGHLRLALCVPALRASQEIDFTHARRKC